MTKKGDRIRLVHMGDDPCPIEPGATGTVTHVFNFATDSQVVVKWDNGRSLMLVAPPDIYEVIPG